MEKDCADWKLLSVKSNFVANLYKFRELVLKIGILLSINKKKNETLV